MFMSDVNPRGLDETFQKLIVRFDFVQRSRPFVVEKGLIRNRDFADAGMNTFHKVNVKEIEFVLSNAKWGGVTGERLTVIWRKNNPPKLGLETRLF